MPENTGFLRLPQEKTPVKSGKIILPQKKSVVSGAESAQSRCAR
jgi:hypothetical protein